MSTLVVQIAELDAAAESMAAVSGSITLGFGEAADARTAMARAVPGSAAALRLPSLPIERLGTVMSESCRVIAIGVAAAADSYRRLEASLQATMTPAGRGTPVPR